MKANFSVIVFLCCMPCFAQGFVDGVVAMVGTDPILYSDVMQEMMSDLVGLEKSGLSQEDLSKQVETFYTQALEREIEYRILFIESQSMGVSVPDEEVDKRIAEIRKQYASTEEYQQALNATGQTAGGFRERIKRQMMALTAKMSKQRQFERDAVITESDLAQYYQDHLDTFRYTAKYLVRRFFLKASSDPVNRQEIKSKVESVRSQLASGADFAVISKEQSEGPEAAEGGLIGWIKPGDLVEPLNAAVQSTAVGQLSDVLETEFGYHLLRVEQIQAEGITPYDEAREEIEPVLRKTQGDERYKRWISTLRLRNDIRIIKESPSF